MTIFSDSALCQVVPFALPLPSPPTITHSYLLWRVACRNRIGRVPLFSVRTNLYQIRGEERENRILILMATS